MAHVITFRTRRFDVSKETPNPVNPIAGQSVLSWLRQELATAGFRCTDPDTEDWGWYMDAESEAGAYMIGASADANDPNPDVEWTIQIHRHRSFKDKLFGRNRETADDPLFRMVEKIVRADPGSHEVTAEG